ncbi:hypothetical protein LY78DRAFT_32630 [Colletotrichum sublineola]|nr:hypothetical protein LY78DRAFT_32630 [Colletotrichum sublineola]
MHSLPPVVGSAQSCRETFIHKRTTHTGFVAFLSISPCDTVRRGRTLATFSSIRPILVSIFRPRQTRHSSPPPLKKGQPQSPPSVNLSRSPSSASAQPVNWSSLPHAVPSTPYLLPPSTILDVRGDAVRVGLRGLHRLIGLC